MKLRSRVLPRAFGAYDVLGKTLPVADIEDICVESDFMAFEDYVECRIMHLVITIFYNDVIFGTLLKAIRANGLSVFAWLELIREMLSSTDLEGLFKEFRIHTENELWENKSDLGTFIQKPGTIQRYVKGEIGFNLLYSFKARSLINHTASMVDIARCAAKRLWLDKSKGESELGRFFDEVIHWDELRMSNIIRGLDLEVTEKFNFDISSFIKTDRIEDLHSYAYEDPVNFSFTLTEHQKDYITRNLNIFGNNDAGVGRILSNSPMKQLLRQPVILDTKKHGILHGQA